MKDAYYFSHDSNARHDPKISAMMNKYGVEGYGRFWIIIEIMREQQAYKLPIKPYLFDALALQMQCAAEEAEKFINDCINTFELFASDGEYFWSNSLIRRMEQKEERSRQASKAARSRWEQSKSNADAMQTQCGSNASKVKESKEKENINKYIVPHEEIVGHLNAACGTKFKPTTKATKSHINARWQEGYRLDDFKTVIECKAKEWLNDPEMSKYLRPETLFGTKFEGYLNQARMARQRHPPETISLNPALLEKYSNPLRKVDKHDRDPPEH